jgi:hypothetical protein
MFFFTTRILATSNNIPKIKFRGAIFEFATFFFSNYLTNDFLKKKNQFDIYGTLLYSSEDIMKKYTSSLSI